MFSEDGGMPWSISSFNKVQCYSELSTYILNSDLVFGKIVRVHTSCFFYNDYNKKCFIDLEMKAQDS